MRYYRNSPIALIIEKKGVDVVRRVSIFQSVTLSVTNTAQLFAICRQLKLLPLTSAKSFSDVTYTDPERTPY